MNVHPHWKERNRYNNHQQPTSPQYFFHYTTVETFHSRILNKYPLQCEVCSLKHRKCEVIPIFPSFILAESLLTINKIK